MRLIHYSDKPLLAMLDVPRERQLDGEKRADGLSNKPVGLWVSVEGPDDWKSWCEGEGFALPRLLVPHLIELSGGANILRISTAMELGAFTKEYTRAADDPCRSRFDRWNINWLALAERYDGIIIAPYIQECRLDPRYAWYYTWDCASGCIWNASAVKSITQLPREEVQKGEPVTCNTKH